MAERCPTPLVSVIMSVSNGGATLSAAVRSLVQQTLSDWELVLVDDGSQDDSVGIVEKFGDPRIRIVRHSESRGLACRLNEAVDLSRGKYVARMDADDICYPERLAVQTGLLLSDPGVDLVGSRALVFRREGDPLGLFPGYSASTATASRLLTGFYFPHPTWCGRADWFRRFRYDVGMIKAQDQELLLRAVPSSRISVVEKILLGYRHERIKLSASARGRFLFTRAIWREARGARQHGRAMMHSVMEVVKFGAECAVVNVGAEQVLLKRRYLPVPPDEITRWRDVWTKIVT